MRFLPLLLLTGIIYAQQEDPPEVKGIPCWCLQGIAKVETRSYWDDQGKFHYIDRRDGADGEIGPFQCTAGAFALVAHKGEVFSRLRHDSTFSCAIALRYLAWLRKRCKSWEEAVGCYNTGLGGSPRIGNQYLLMVKLAAGLTP